MKHINDMVARQHKSMGSETINQNRLQNFVCPDKSNLNFEK